MSSITKTATTIFACQDLSKCAIDVINAFLHTTESISWETYLFNIYKNDAEEYGYLWTHAPEHVVRQQTGVRELYQLDADWYNIPDLLQSLRKLKDATRPTFLVFRRDGFTHCIAVRDGWRRLVSSRCPHVCEACGVSGA